MSAAVHEPGDARPIPTPPEIARWLAVLTEAEQLVELRAPRARPDGNTASHFYTSDRLEDLSTRALAYSGTVPGVYFTLNPIRPDHPRNRAARDGDVLARRRLLVDCDAVRPGDSSATDAERAAALDVARAIRARQRVLDWPEPALCDSGNGYHLIYGLDLPNDDASKVLIRACLEALNYQFGTAAVKVDASVFNASRITKVYGTVAAKGKPTPERPHRHSRLIEAPTCLEYADLAALQALAADAPPKTIPIHGPAPASRPRREVPAGEWSAEDRARAYLDRVEPAVSGQRGHNQAFKAACKVGPGFDLPPDRALALLGEWNDTCQPPWNEKELAHKVEEAYKVEARRGWLLGGDGPTSKTSYTQKGPGAGAGGGVNGAYDVLDVGSPDDDRPVVVRAWPDPPSLDAWYGIAGDLARAVEEQTEADPIGVLIQFMAGWGNLIGRRAHWQANATKHFTNLFVCTAGPSGIGRKGTAWDICKLFLARVDAAWAKDRLLGGLSSGEGLIAAVRDPQEATEDVKDKGRVVGRQQVLKDPGVLDKRLVAVETEFSRTLKSLSRDGNILDGVLRQAWDHGNLGTMVRTNPLAATDAHVSIIGHITEGEAARYLSETQATNGFANRFLWVCVRRSKLLPHAPAIRLDLHQDLLDRIARVTGRALLADPDIPMRRSAAADALWEGVYGGLTDGKPGLLGVVTSRGDAQAMRLACLYALLDGSSTIEEAHLRAGLAFWRYAERSAAYIFGDALGDRDADRLLSELRSTALGLTQTQIYRDMFSKNKSRDEIARILGRLLEAGKVRSESDHSTGGRPVTRWFAT
jgi:hypothetical protein